MHGCLRVVHMCVHQLKAMSVCTCLQLIHLLHYIMFIPYSQKFFTAKHFEILFYDFF